MCEFILEKHHTTVTFAVKGTGVWGFSSMNSHMHSIAVLVNVTPLTVGTNEGCRDFVPFLVDRQLVFSGTDFEANFAAPLKTAVLLVRGFHLPTVIVSRLLRSCGARL